MSQTSAKLRRLYIERWNDLSHQRQKEIFKRFHPVFANFLNRHNLTVCGTCNDMFLGDECLRCDVVHTETRFDDVNAEISRERDWEIYASVR